MHFKRGRINSGKYEMLDDIRNAAASAKNRRLSMTISNTFCRNNYLPATVDGKPEKVVLDYRGELLKVIFGDCAVLFENLSDAAIVTIHVKLESMGIIKRQK